MPRSEARILTSIWKDEDFLALPPGAQRLYMFLLSQDDLAYCGVMPLRERRWVSKAAGMTLADIEQDLKALEAAGRMFIVTDEGTGELLIRSLVRRDGIWKQPNLLKLARESADQVESPKIRSAMLSELRRLPLEETPSAQVRTLVADFIHDLGQGKPYPADYAAPNPSDNPTAHGSDEPSGDPTAEDHACAQGNGDRNVPVLGSPEPLFPDSPKDLSASARKLGTRLPDDFALTPDMLTWARENAPHVDARLEFDVFCDYWREKPGKEGRKITWLGTWRNWMRKAEDRQGPRDRPSRQQSDQDQLQRAMERANQRTGELT